MAKPEVLMISKPVAPPWHDSGKNLVRDIAVELSEVRPRLMTPDMVIEGLGDAILEPIYGKPSGTGYAPALQQNARVFKRLLRGKGESLRHFFFAPNTKTSGVGRVVSAMHRRIPTVQTIMSVPKSFDDAPGLMFTDAVVTLSAYTQAQLERRGITNARLIYPGVDMAPEPRAPAGDHASRDELRAHFELPTDRTVFTFAGDYQFSNASHLVASAVEQLFEGGGTVRDSICVVFACRIKQEESRAIEAGIRQKLSKWINPKQLVFLNEVPRILDLLAASDVLMLPADSTYAKMDIPLVLVEAMREERPVIVADAGPLPEVVGGEDVGCCVSPKSGEALAQAMLSYIEQPNKLLTQGRLARERATNVFDSRKMAPAYEVLYTELLSRSSFNRS